jgi:hypothetical protein
MCDFLRGVLWWSCGDLLVKRGELHHVLLGAKKMPLFENSSWKNFRG